MGEHNFYILNDAQLDSISHIFPYDRKLEQMSSFNYPVDCFGRYLNEPDATPVLIKHLRDLLFDSLQRFEYRIVDVHDDKRYTITLPTNLNGNISIKVWLLVLNKFDQYTYITVRLRQKPKPKPTSLFWVLMFLVIIMNEVSL